MKKIITNYVLIFGILMSIFIAGCGNDNSKPKITHIPVQLKSEGNWSLVDISTGKIIFEGEFKNEPSVATEGVFITTNKEGEKFYNKIVDEKKYDQIAGPFVSGNLMKSDIAIVCKEDAYPTAINASGEEVFSLEPKDGVVFTEVGQCFDGKIKFKSDKDLWGFINKKGEIVIKPQFDYVDDFNNGLARATIHDGKKNKLVLINDDGVIVKEIDKSYVGNVVDGKMVYTDENDEFGILSANEELEKVLSASSKYEQICLNGEDIFYSSDKEWGLMNEKGESVIRPKYRQLTRLSSDVFLGLKQDGDDMEYHLLDAKGEIKKKDEVDGGMYGAYNLQNGNFIHKDGKEYQLLNANGEVVGDATFKSWSGRSDIYMLTNNISSTVESEYFDWDKIKEFISSMKNGSISKLSLGMNCVNSDTELNKMSKSNAADTKGDSESGIGLQMAYMVGDFSDYNTCFGLFIGVGYNDEKASNGDSGNDDSSMDADSSAAPTSAAASEYSTANSVKDNAPEWSSYQTYLNGSIDLGKSGSISMTLRFDDYIKKATTQSETVDNGYYSYEQLRIVGYDKNPEAKLQTIGASINVSSKKEKKLAKLIDDHFSKGFNFQGENYGSKKYVDGSGNTWEVKGAEIYVSKPVAYSSEYGY